MKFKVELSWVVVIILTELILLHFLYSSIYNYSDIKNVVDAFAFGGTLVGIIVGVIAIIYAFYQGAAQQNTNNTMVSELTKLAGIKEDIGASALALKEELKGLSAVTTKLVDIETSVGVVGEGVKQLSTSIVSQVKIDPVVGVSNDTTEDFILRTAQSFMSRQTGFYVAFSAYLLSSRKFKSMPAHGHRIYKVLAKHVSSYGNHDVGDNVLTAIINVTLGFFVTLDLVELDIVEGDEDKRGVSWEVNEDYAKTLEALRKYILNLDSIDEEHMSAISEILDMKN